MLIEFESSSILITLLKYKFNPRFIGKGAEYPVSFVKHTNASLFYGWSPGFGQNFKFAKLSSNWHEIIKICLIYLKMNIFLY